MRYALVALLVMLGLAGCGSDAPQSESVASQAAAEPSLVPLLDRPRRAEDYFPPSEIDKRMTEVNPDPGSARFVGRLDNGFTAWVMRATAADQGALTDGPDRICLYLLDARREFMSAKCGGRRERDQPGRLMVLLSGGAAGMPGLRPREVIVLGVATAGFQGVRFIGDRAAPIALSSGVFLGAAAFPVRGIQMMDGHGRWYRLGFDACQSC